MNRRVQAAGEKRIPKRESYLFRRPVKHNESKVKAHETDSSSGSRSRDTGVSPKRIGLGYVILITLIGVGVASAFVYHLNVRFEGIRLGYETSKARALKTKLLLERRELRLELASLKSPEKVEAEARERLGMTVPDHLRIITIGKKRKMVSASGGAL